MARIIGSHRIGKTVLPLALMVLVAFVSACRTAPPPSVEEAEKAIGSAFKGATKKGNPGQVASLLVHSDRLGIHELYRANPEGADAFHIASVGKLFTTVLIGRLIDEGRLSLNSPVAPLLQAGILDGLFVFEGTDYQGQVTIGQLLAHTSGVADYFSGPVRGGKNEKTVEALIVSEPERRWTPLDLVAFSRDRQEAVGVPETVYNYSDTGFVILGLVIEALYGRPYHVALQNEILGPLGMDTTFMPFVSSPQNGTGTELRKAWLGKTEVSAYPSITADWAGGGIASTEEDLLLFSRALWSGKLLSEKTLASLRHYDRSFMTGIKYGIGIMRIEYGEFFFLLKDYPKTEGHIGILSTMLFYSPDLDTHFILNFGSTADMEAGFRLLIQVLGILIRMA